MLTGGFKPVVDPSVFFQSNFRPRAKYRLFAAFITVGAFREGCTYPNRPQIDEFGYPETQRKYDNVVGVRMGRNLVGAKKC